ncbi:hypothetical protein IU403_03255 [Aerococcaceae bacterium zg-BR22]|uniref:hypothetical protein n=1 Tax=Aerococcaceae bacterium zg-1292 TaxID=2774330 RepID=UPI004062D9FA|nr:hypothetical protein [Aerococcaceae bacterium zg-BR22]
MWHIHLYRIKRKLQQSIDNEEIIIGFGDTKLERKIEFTEGNFNFITKLNHTNEAIKIDILDWRVSKYDLSIKTTVSD